MIAVTIDSKAVLDLIKALPKQAGRAAEIALDKTALDIKATEVAKMKQVFDSPVRYTLNSLRVTRTHNHNMQASVGFKEPPRMGQHYLVPEVEGTPRKYKGFERAFGDVMFVPGKFARRTKAGNVSTKQIRDIVTAIGKSVDKKGDYVPILKRHGKLYPGIYRRFAKGSRGVRSGTHRANQWGRKRGRFRSAVRARGLKPIMLVGRQKAAYKPRLPFYEVAQETYSKTFHVHFYRELDKQLGL